MPSAINTNLNALAAQRQLSLGAAGLGSTIQRLSSGLRINSAKDDAAGLAISERFTTQIRGVDQAARNTNDGISLAQTAEAALGQISTNLQRMRELAVQSANGTNSTSDRAALQAEAQQLVDEINQIATKTEFNGTRLLDGSFVGQLFQLGANRQQTVSAGAIASMTTDALGQTNGFQGLKYPSIFAGPSDFTVTLNGPGTTYDLGIVDSDPKLIADAINAARLPGLSALVPFSTTQLGWPPTSAGTSDGMVVYTINGTDINIPYKAGSSTEAIRTRVTAAVAAINANSAVTGVFATDAGSNGINLTSVDGRNVNLSFSAGTATGATDMDYGLFFAPFVQVVAFYYEAPRGSAVTSVTFTGSGVNTSFSVTQVGQSLRTMDISSANGAQQAIKSIDIALRSVGAARTTMGALQNDLDATLTHLQRSGENMSAARSRIVDADFAQETASLSRAQILQQASTAMVAQANQSPQGVLALLR